MLEVTFRFAIQMFYNRIKVFSTILQNCYSPPIKTASINKGVYAARGKCIQRGETDAFDLHPGITFRKRSRPKFSPGFLNVCHHSTTL